MIHVESLPWYVCMSSSWSKPSYDRLFWKKGVPEGACKGPSPAASGGTSRLIHWLLHTSDQGLACAIRRVSSRASKTYTSTVSLTLEGTGAFFLKQQSSACSTVTCAWSACNHLRWWLWCRTSQRGEWNCVCFCCWHQREILISYLPRCTSIDSRTKATRRGSFHARAEGANLRQRFSGIVIRQ